MAGLVHALRTSQKARLKRWARPCTIRRLSVCLFVALIAAVAADAALPPNRITAGDVTASSAVLWARSDVATTVAFLYAPFIEGELRDWQVVTEDVADPSVPAKVEILRKIPGTLYVYAVSTDFGASFDVGWFRTPHLVGADHGLRFGVSGDSRGELAPLP